MPDKKPAAPPEEKGFFQRLAERFFPPATLGAEIQKRMPKTPPPPVRRRTPQPPIDKMAGNPASQGKN